MGWPEGLFIILIIATMIPAFALAARPQDGVVWAQAPGYITSGTRESVHFNSQLNDDKITVTYEYTVDGINYDGTWSGFWPPLGGYNALDPDSIDSLLAGEIPITVSYDPAEPAIHQTHPESSLSWIVFMMLFILGMASTFFYVTVLYPRIRLR